MTVTTDYVVNGPAGVVISDTSDTPQFALGRKVEFASGKVFRYVRTMAALAQGSVYALSSTFTVGNAVVASVDSILTPFGCGVPQVAFAAPSSGFTYRYGWVQTAGTFTYLKLCGGTTKDNMLYISSLAGALNSIHSATASTVVNAVKYLGDSAVATAGSITSTAFSPVELVVPREYQ